MRHLTRLFIHLDRRRRLQIFLLGVVIVFASLIELASFGMIIPFLNLMTFPDKIYQNDFGKFFIEYLNIERSDQLLFPVTIIFVFFAIASASLKIFQTWVGTRLAFAIGSDFGLSIYETTLHQPYSLHISRNSSEVLSGIMSKTSAVISGGIVPTLNLASSLVTLIVILTGLIIIDPKVTLSVLFGFAVAYTILVVAIRKMLLRNGNIVAIGSTRLIKSVQEGLGGIRDIILDGSQNVYCYNFKVVDQELRNAQARAQFISLSPRYFMEAVGLTIFAVISYYYFQHFRGLDRVLPILGVLALTAQRLLPVLQQAYVAWANIKSAQASILAALDLIGQSKLDMPHTNAPSINFQYDIRLSNVTFKYENGLHPVLSNIDLRIQKGERIGVTGVSGSGKSTLMDIMMGLLAPTFGHLEVDGIKINMSNSRSWQKHVAHVPQAIYLADTTISENIAFGVSPAKIDHTRIREVAKQARIDKFIESMPMNYCSLVGERGVQLSGGQRQRIGLARALYKQADVIFLDEATSALDSAMEEEVMDSIKNLKRDITLIIVAHRHSTLEFCDRIIHIESGIIVSDKNLKN